MGVDFMDLHADGEGDRATLHDAIWSATEDFIAFYVGGKSYRGAWGYLGEAISEARDRGMWGPTKDVLRFGFPDFAGCCTRSVSAWVHWVELTWASIGDELAVTAEKSGFTLSGLPDIDRALASNARFLIARGDLWSVERDGLFADDRHLPIEALESGERQAAGRAIERCQCALCTMIRPDKCFERAMIEGLAQSDPSERDSALWYVSHMARPSGAILEQLLRTAPDTGTRDVQRALDMVIPRCRDAASVLDAVSPRLTGGARAMGLYGRCIAEARKDRDHRVPRALVDEILEATRWATPALLSVAAEILGRDARALREPAGRALVDVLARPLDPEVRHDVALGLFNVYLPRANEERPEVPIEVLDAFRDLAEGNDRAGGFARWALTALS